MLRFEPDQDSENNSDPAIDLEYDLDLGPDHEPRHEYDLDLNRERDPENERDCESIHGPVHDRGRAPDSNEYPSPGSSVDR